MKAEIIAIGTELLMGETQDTNSSWIGGRLPELGLELQWVTTVGDDMHRLTEAVARAWERSAVVLTIGGLGPTLDDVTRDAVAKVLGEEVTTDSELRNWLEESFRRRNRPMAKHNLRQAGIIPSARALHNPLGTAPSWWIERDGRILVTLPGPPRELMNMWQTEIAPRLRERLSGDAIRARTFKTIGLSEAEVDELVQDAYRIPDIDLGVYAKPDGIYVRAIARGRTDAAALEALSTAESMVGAALGDSVWGTDDDAPAEKVGELLRERGYKLAVLESCTGGMLSAAITDIPGASDYFLGGGVTYSVDLKLRAGVPREVVDAHGIYSAETARAMALAGRTTYEADCAIGVTGIAGAEDIEGVLGGTVFIGVALPGGVQVAEHRFPSRRPLVRARATTMALLQLVKALQEEEPAKQAG